MINKCNQCKKEYEIYPSRAKISKFCSSKCSSEFQRNNRPYKPSIDEINIHIEFIKNNINNVKSISVLNLLCINNNIKFSNDTRVKNIIKKLNLNTNHFISTRGNIYSNKELFKLGTEFKYSTVKNRIIDECLLEYKCVKCGIEDTWNDKKINLDLDHINGNPKDNRLENLRFLCPNCHSQTETYKGKNI